MTSRKGCISAFFFGDISMSYRSDVALAMSKDNWQTVNYPGLKAEA